MDKASSTSIDLADAYLQVAGDRAKFLKAIVHVTGCPVSGRPNRTGERRDIGLIDYRLAFGTDGRPAMAVHENLAGKWFSGESSAVPPRASKWHVHDLRHAPDLDWRFTSLPAHTPRPGRVLLAKDAVEIDGWAHRAIMRFCIRAKPGDAPSCGPERDQAAP